MDVAALIENPYVAGMLGVLSGGAVAYVKRWFDLRAARLEKEHANQMARLDLEAQRLVLEQELLAESKKRTTGRATPTGLRHQVVKKELMTTFSGVAPEAIDARIKEHARTASASVKTIAPSIMPTASESQQRLAAVKVALDGAPELSRPSGEFRGIDFSAVEDIADANETGEDE